MAGQIFPANGKNRERRPATVVDVEELNGVSPAKMRQELKDFVTYVETKTGVKPIIYSGISYYQDYLAGFLMNIPFG